MTQAELITGILTRKKAGKDCTENESAELKQYLKYHLPRDSNVKSIMDLVNDIVSLFPLEYSEVLEELENPALYY